MDAIDTHLSTYPGSPIVLDVLGTLDAEEIRARAFELEPAGVEVFYFAASVGALFGVRLRDGSRVAIKVNTLFRDSAYFADVQRVQAALHAEGFPAPRPIRTVGAVTIDEWVDDGAFRDGHEPEVRRALAETLVQLVDLATASGVRPRREFLRPEGATWPKPHNALFDFAATAAGAEWIDEIGARALLPRSGREVVGHSDWAAKHVRFDDELQPTAVYDWDLNTECEPVVAGSAAGTFVYTEELDRRVRRWPTPDESLAFLEDYERARSSPFTREDRRLAQASCVYVIAYSARCHHSIDGDPADMHLAEFAEALL